MFKSKAAKLKKLKINNSFNSGYTFIEILVALGVISIASVAMLTVASDTGKQDQLLKSKLEILEIQQAVDRLVYDSKSCSCMFQGIALPNPGGSLDLNEIKNGCKTAATGLNSNLLLQTNQPPNANSTLNVKTIKLTNIEDLNFGNKAADIEIEFSTKDGLIKKINIPSTPFVIQANTISKCLSNGVVQTPISKCAADGRVFVGFQPYNNQNPDLNGCLPLSAFQGKQGPQGPQGVQGVQGVVPVAIPKPPPPPSQIITVSGTYGASCPPSGVLMDCWKTGTGINNSMTFTANGCIAWEGGNNGGMPGCACRCYMP